MSLIPNELLVGIFQESLNEFHCKRNEVSCVDVRSKGSEWCHFALHFPQPVKRLVRTTK